ncbi:unnamed protein product [Trichobilharzia szidati]|nr:unnamed protein product [Trichobilharzia szidati]
MCDLFEEVEGVEVTVHKNIVLCNVTCIERPETKVIIVGSDVLFFDQTFRNTYSYKHGCNILQACAPAIAVLLFLLDEQGFMSIYLSGTCEPAYTVTQLGKIHDLQLVTTSPTTFDLLLRSEDSLSICRDLNTTQLHSELTERKFEELEDHFRSTESISVLGKAFFCNCSSPALLWNIQLTSPGIITAHMKESHEFYIRNLFDPLSVIEDIRFRKVSLISDSVYCMALTSSGQLYLLNLFAGVCLGSLSQFPNVNDFFICQSTSKIPVNSTSEYSGLCEVTIFILRDLEENDQPSCTGPTKLLEVVLFPSYQIIYKMHVTKESWLLSNYDLGDYKSEGIALPETSVLYAELHSDHSDDSTENCLLSIKTLKTTNPKQRLERLLKLEKFEEARLLVISFSLDSSDFQLVVLTELQFVVNAIHKQENDVNLLYPRLLKCLQEVEMLWKNLEIVDSIAEITIPSSDDQMKLLLTLKEKLMTDDLESISTEHQERGTKVLRLLKRLKTYLLIYGSSYTPEQWILFRDANVYSVFTNLFISNDEAGSLDRAFLFWMMYKGELVQFITWEALKTLFGLLSKRPLTYIPSCGFTHENGNIEHISRESEMVESEEALHKWLRNELLPVLIKQCPDTLSILVDFLVSRVRKLEACSLKSPSDNHTRDEKVKCPFPWPSTAISWINKFLESVNIPESNSEENSINTIALSDLYFSGLASRNPDLDPFYELRKLAKQLDTIKHLLDGYNFHLSIDSCEDETDLSIAYHFLDTAFNLSISFDKGVDKLTAQYLKDKNIDYQTFLQAYLSHLINRIKDVPVSENDDTSETSSKLNSDFTRVKLIVQRACLITSWITIPSCRIKAVLNLTSAAPLPWTDGLFQLSEGVLKQTCISNSQSKYLDGLTQAMNRLELSYNRARLYKICTRYKLQEFSRRCFKRRTCLRLTGDIISRILYSTEGPFGVNTSFSTPKISSDDSVYRDAVTVAKILLSEYKWPWLLAQLYMNLTLFKIMGQKEADITNATDEYESRISFFISHLNFCANETLYQLLNQSNKLNDTTRQFLFIRNWLIQLAFRSFKQLLNPRNILFSFQRSLIVDLGLLLAVLKSTSEQEKNMTQMNWISLMKFTKLYFPSSSANNDVEYISDGSEESIILQLFSKDKLLPALLSDRLILIRRLTKLYVKCLNLSTVSNEIDHLFNIPIKLRTCYSYLLSDISNGVRDELMHWEWFACLCSTICSSKFSCESDNDNDNKLNDPNLIISRSLQVQSVLMKLTEILLYGVREPRVYTVRDKSKNEIGQILTKHNNVFVSKCAYCACIWNQPLARFGCIIELYRQSILPFLSKTLELLHLMELNTYELIINIIRTVFDAFSSLIHWSIGDSNFNSLIEKKCVCPLLVSTNEFQALRQIIEAFSNVFDQIGRAYEKLEIRDKDLLECVLYTSIYHEQTTKDILSSKIHLNQFSNCLKWLSSLLKWFIPSNSCGSSNRINNSGKEGGGEGKKEQPKKNEYKVLIHQLLEDGMAIASNWSAEFGLYLTGAHSLLIGIMNLFQSSVIQNMWPNSFFIDFTGKTINDDTITKCLKLCVKCLSSSLKSVLNPVDGKYLDQSLALCLSLALPVGEAVSIVRDVVAHSKHTPKKVKALANIIFMVSQITPRFGLELLPLSQNMAKMWTWHILLKPYKLEFSRIMTNGMDDTLLERVLDKLCRMIPSWKEESAYLLPSDTQAKSALPKLNSSIKRSLPSIKLIITFSKDFNMPLKQYLLKHLDALLRTSYETSVNSVPDFETLINENSDQSLSTSTDPMNNSKLQCFIRYQKLCLSRAYTILKLLFRSAKQSNDPQSSLRDLAELIHSYYASTSPYDYERLSFIYSWIRACVGKGMITEKQIQLLYHLRYYRRVCPPRDSEFESISPGNCEDFIFSKGENHPMCHIRIPYHQLLTDSFPSYIIGQEITPSTLNFWLNVSRIMQWSSDVIKIAAAQNLFNQYSTVGLLPMANSNNISEELTIPRSVGWDRALPCQHLIEPLFHKLFYILESVTSTSTVYSLLSGIARRVIYGPHRLLVLKLAHNLAEVYLTKVEDRARQLHSQNVPLTKECAEDKSLDSHDCENEVYKSVQLEQIALEKTEASYKQLAIEGCLYKYHLAHWEEVNKHINSPFELILNLLYKTASCLQRSTTNNCKSELPLSDLFLRRQIDEALPHIAQLANINLMDVATYVIVNRVNIPSHLFKNHQLINETCITNRSLSLDMTFEAGELTPDDISFNATMYESQLDRVSSSADNQKSSHLEPTEEDFMLAELILSQAQIKQELLSILEAFVFAGTPGQYISAKWRATRCILRCEMGCYLRPKLSMVELRAALLRLSTLASCSTSMYQQLLCDASVSCTSSRGDTYSSLHPSRLENSIKQLLMTSDNLTVLNLTSHLILHYELLSFPILKQLFECIHHLNVTEALDIAFVLLTFIQSTVNVNESMKWLFLNPVKQNSLLHSIISSLIEKLFQRIMTPGQRDSRKIQIQISRSLYFLISWPFPDKEIENIFVQFSHSVGHMLSQQSMRVRDLPQRSSILLVIFLHLLASSASNPQISNDLNAYYKQIVGGEDKQNTVNLIRDAIRDSEIFLTSKFLCYPLLEN